jgi:hypothetical protein
MGMNFTPHRINEIYSTIKESKLLFLAMNNFFLLKKKILFILFYLET